MSLKGKNKNKKLSTPTETILESISDGVFTVDLDWRITSFNRAAEEITGVYRSEAIGRICSEVFRSSMCEGNCALEHTMKTGIPVISKTCYIINSEGKRIPISVSTARLVNENSEVIGGAETFRDMSELEELRRELKGRFHVGDMTSRSPLMRDIFNIIEAIAASNSNVLIQGESGTGKEIVACTIHSLSMYSDGPFIAVNCSAMPDTLLESELFGYKAGAFTGAVKDKPGRFEIANGGTLFLDEIGNMAMPLQAKLLRVLQDKVYEPLGSTKSQKTDARIIAATNLDLLEQVKMNKFREDLYYRIKVILINLPPLHRRKEDIPLLVEEFITKFNRLQNKQIEGITDEALHLLMAYNWPGNIRELENIIERAFILCNEGLIDIKHLPDELKMQDSCKGTTGSLRSIRDTVESQNIINALERNNYNRVAAARELGIDRSTFYRKIRKLGIKIPAKNGRSAIQDK